VTLSYPCFLTQTDFQQLNVGIVETKTISFKFLLTLSRTAFHSPDITDSVTVIRDRMALTFVLPSRSLHRADGQTDRRTDGRTDCKT